MVSYGFIKSPPDSRDIVFNMATVVPDKYLLQNVPNVVDQGADPICAAISLSHIINWQERAKAGKDAVTARSIYSLRKDQSMRGMIPREALKSLKNEGTGGYNIKAYSRIVNPDSAKAAIQVNGPIMICVYAYDTDCFWRPHGKTLGGHAVIFTGWSKDGFVLQNSWGTSWGTNGKMTFPYDDWKYVIESWTIII